MAANTIEQPRRVLFLCTGNSCRSQMAEGWARHLHGTWLQAFSAGTEPHGIDPRAVAAMREVGVDIRAQTSKHVDQLLDVPFDLVVTVCDHAAASCPRFPRPLPTRHHAFPDPPHLARCLGDNADPLRPYREVRDAIRHFVATLPEILEESCKKNA